ncbi:MAG TPA: fibronectin type III domain-containing protein [Terracidiphilus sp.]|nr:fibronectin type III domain-containing protein [Terracidiphilus sp.]
MLVGCGGSTQVSPPAPIFDSTPVTAATEGSAYSYQIVATDPAGSAVTFTLTNSPAGAALSGNTITWTPTPAQSRLANGFTVTATTAAGGAATQSWALTPNGTIHLSWVETYWTASGPIAVPFDWTTNVGQAQARLVKALIPQPDGSLLALGGSGNSDGTFSIPNVPGGYYWLRIAPLAIYWTSSSTFDFGIDLIGHPSNPTSNITNTVISVNVGGLDPIQAQDWFGFAADLQIPLPFLDSPLSGPLGSTTFGSSVTINSNFDFSQINTIFLGQYEPASPSSLDALVLGPELTLSNVTINNGTVNTVAGTLNASPKASLAVSIKGSAWANLFNHVAPAPVTPVGSVLTVSAQPFVADRNAVPMQSLLGPNLPLITPDLSALLSRFGFLAGPVSACGDWSGLFGSSLYESPILTDQDFGTIQYGDPFPASWPRVFNFCEIVSVPVAIPNSSSTYAFLLYYGEATNLPTLPVSPLVSAVQNPTINGSSFFVASTIDSTSVTLNWSPPTGTALYGYYVRPFVPVTLPDGTMAYLPAGKFGTAKTSMTVPMLSPGQTYVFLLSAEVDGRANMETSPNRSALPTAYANVVSAPITISSAALHNSSAAMPTALASPRNCQPIQHLSISTFAESARLSGAIGGRVSAHGRHKSVAQVN